MPPGSRQPRRGLKAAFDAFVGPVVAAVSPPAVLNALIPRRGYHARTDLPYGPASRQVLDLYIPDRLAGPAPVLLFFYGGSWQSGSKDIYRGVGQAFATRGIIVAVADYRLYPEVRYPAFVEDGALALRYLYQNAPGFGGDPGRIVVSGHSAGAYIAVMLGVDPRYLRKAHAERSWIRGIVGIAGPYDFLPLRDPALIDLFGGEAVRDTQPIEHVHAGCPPMLLAHGTADTTVGVHNTRRMAAKLREAGCAVETREYQRTGHIGIIVSLAPGFRRRTSLRADMLRFVHGH